MFEEAEIRHEISKDEYKKRVPALRKSLLDTQMDLQKRAEFPVILLISGVDGGGKGAVINTLHEWMDARYIRTHAFWTPTEDERERPPYWRFWMALPPKGYIGIFVGSWYSDPLSKRVNKKIDNEELDASLIHIQQMEKELCDDGAVIIKCWIHLSKSNQEKRFREYKKDPDQQWRITERHRKNLKLYDYFVPIAERVLRETSTGHAPWQIIDGSDIRYACLTVGEYILDRITSHIRERSAAPGKTKAAAATGKNKSGLLASLDLGKKLEKKEYNRKLNKYQGKLNLLARDALTAKVSAIFLFEGWDAAGKGGVIRRITHALDARQYRVIQIAAPTDEEKAHHYLWRFWRHLPRRGQVTIYDRSWYGRVLVERVEGFAGREEWMRAYHEITDFEEELTDAGIVLVKFWLHIDAEEQLRRFKEREQTDYKRHKITAEDYRNRQKWPEYEAAVNDMITRTSTEYARWHIIEANDKYNARIRVLKTCCDALGDALR